MDIKEYISSGILEDYLMGNVSEQEQKEIQCLSSIYPEIREALDERAQELDLLAQHFEESPSSGLKSSLMSEISTTDQEKSPQIPEEEQSVDPLPFKSTSSSDASPDMDRPGTISRTMWIGLAASFLLLVGAFWVYYSWDVSYEDQIAELQQEKQQLEEQLTQVQTTYKDQLQQLASTDINKVQLNAVTEGSAQNAIVMWDPQTEQVYLNPKGLEDPPIGKQYQLWALKDDQPIDLGVFSLEDVDIIKEMRPVKSADAFAITLEPKGGNAQPTLEQLQVLGEVAG